MKSDRLTPMALNKYRGIAARKLERLLDLLTLHFGLHDVGPQNE